MGPVHPGFPESADFRRQGVAWILLADFSTGHEKPVSGVDKKRGYRFTGNFPLRKSGPQGQDGLLLGIVPGIPGAASFGKRRLDQKKVADYKRLLPPVSK